MENEKVLVIPAKDVKQMPEGFVKDCSAWQQAVLDARVFIDRVVAEQDENWRQVIPYVIFVKDTGFEVLTSDSEIFCYRRGGSELRLSKQISFGFGGHINAQDLRKDSLPLNVGLQRELDEEVCLLGAKPRQWVGMINDTSNAVGRVHLGVVYIQRVSSVTMRDGSQDVADRWMTAAECYQAFTRLEPWSQIALKALFPMFVGLTEQEALSQARATDIPTRISSKDGVAAIKTMEFSPGRANLDIEGGKVIGEQWG